MEEGTYSLSVKVGGAEFQAQGPEAQVKADFQTFLEALRQLGPKAPAGQLGPGASGVARDDDEEPVERPQMEKVFQKAGDVVSLRVLPADSPNKAADAGILLLYGYHQLAARDEVLVTKLKAGLEKSGVSVDRVDRTLEPNRALFIKGGARSGSTYQLNNQGTAFAEEMIRRFQMR